MTVNRRWSYRTPALLTALREQKAALHGLVEAVEERAAIAEYDGRVTQPEAEALAWECIMQVQEAAVPCIPTPF